MSLNLSSGLMPHGYCLIWNSALLWLHVISDALIVLSYYAIPLALLYFIRRYKNFPFNKLLFMYAAFILACGTTHLISIITIWQPIYWLEGWMKFLTALLSIITAIVTITIAPKALAEIGYKQRLEEEIIKNSRIATATFESVQSMYVTDAQGYFIKINKAFSELTGYSMADLAGKKARILNTERQDAEFFKNLGELLLRDGYWSGEVKQKKKNGEFFLELVNIIAVKDEQDCITHYVINCTNIDVIKAYEAGLIEAKEKAERFSTLKTQFIASMSHEIRTPMAAIIGFSDLSLLDDIDMPEEIRIYLQHINTASNSLLGILNDILDFTKLETGYVVIEHHPLSIHDLLNSIGTLFNGSAKQKGIAFTIAHDSTIPLEVLGDKLRVQQVLTNLVGNAIKFTAQGSVKLEVTLQKMTSTQVQLLFTVTDTGIGIALEHQDRLFKEFSQIDGSFTRKYGGTGLDLVISKELVELMGGEIKVVSEKDHGSCFSFALLFDVNKESIDYDNYSTTISQEQSSECYSNKFKGYRVLVVEDNTFAQEIIQKHLLNLGVDYLLAEDGEKALTLLEEQDFDLVLMDIQMPVMNGIETTELIRQQEKYASLPIIALSAGVTELERNNCIACGIEGFINKPYKFNELYDELGVWLKPKY
jgi:PAS domain S-box-containing protein